MRKKGEKYRTLSFYVAVKPTLIRKQPLEFGLRWPLQNVVQDSTSMPDTLLRLADSQSSVSLSFFPCQPHSLLPISIPHKFRRARRKNRFRSTRYVRGLSFPLITLFAAN